MKTIKYLSLRVLAVAALALVFALPTKAQMTDNGYANIDGNITFPSATTSPTNQAAGV